MTNKFFGTKLLATALATFALASCQSESSLIEPSSDNRRDVELTLTATKGDLLTRTGLILDDKELQLIKTWDMKDKVHVCEADGNYVGYLEVTGLNEDQTKAYFKGIVRLLDKDGIQKLYFSSVGTDKENEGYTPKLGAGMPDLVYDFAEQTSTDVNALNANDLMTAGCDVEVKGKKAQFTNLLLTREFAYGRFKLLYNDQPLGFADNTKVTVNTKTHDIKSKGTITFPETVNGDGETSLTVTTDVNDFYVTFVPGSNESELEFKVTVDGVSYIGYTNRAYLIAGNKYFRANAGGPLPVNVRREDGKYEQKEYCLIYNSNFGENAVDKVSVESTGKNYEFIVKDYKDLRLPSREGYIFTGWKDNTSEDFAVGDKFTIKSNPNEAGVSSDELYAQWEIDYKVTLKNEDGDVIETLGTPSTESTQVVDLPEAPKKTGHAFKGWKKEGGKDEEAVTGSWKLTESNPQVTLVPVYEQYVYKFTYNPNHENIKEKYYSYRGDKPSWTHTVRKYDDEEFKEFIWEGHEIVGWNTKPDGTGTSYQPDDKVNFSYPDITNIKVYAIWEEINKDSEATITLPGAKGQGY